MRFCNYHPNQNAPHAPYLPIAPLRRNIAQDENATTTRVSRITWRSYDCSNPRTSARYELVRLSLGLPPCSSSARRNTRGRETSPCTYSMRLYFKRAPVIRSCHGVAWPGLLGGRCRGLLWEQVGKEWLAGVLSTSASFSPM